MGSRSVALRLDDMIEAGERVQAVATTLTADVAEEDWQTIWLMQRGIEIISEASRHLPDDLKARHPEIPWRKLADYRERAAPWLSDCLCAAFAEAGGRGSGDVNGGLPCRTGFKPVGRKREAPPPIGVPPRKGGGASHVQPKISVGPPFRWFRCLMKNPPDQQRKSNHHDQNHPRCQITIFQ